MVLDLKKKYINKIIPQLINEFNFKSIMQVSKIDKIVINTGLGKYIGNKKYFNYVFDTLYLITGQKPIFTIAKKSIASFKIRKKNILGYKLTLRKNIMWNFLEKLIKIVIPKLKNFNGFIIKSFDINNNFNFGINDHSLFPEIDYEKIIFIYGFNINIVFKNNNLLENKKILSLLNFPFKK